MERHNGERLRTYRKMSKQGLSLRIIQDKYAAMIASETRGMLQQVTDHPDQLLEAIRRYVQVMFMESTPMLMRWNLAVEAKLF